MKYFISLFCSVFLLNCQYAGPVKGKLDFAGSLVGTWEAKAFSGKLHEKWETTEVGWIEQEGCYIEGTDTSYSAKTKMEIVGGELILFSVIKKSNPKIFKAVFSTKDSIIFENTDYKNPFKVKYEFLGEENYRRTITGYEKDSMVILSFDFNKGR